MKISEIFGLNKTQHELDFVDIDPDQDKAVFLDPFFISTRKHPWCEDADRMIKSFFQLIIDLIKQGEEKQARTLFTHLNEPNETCLGLSRSAPQGRGVGDFEAMQIFDSILMSKAVQTGLVEDLEDTAIFIDGINRDKVSDMTTNIIKRHLLDYTKSQCVLWDIPLTKDVPSGFFWNTDIRDWDANYYERLIVNEKSLLLVPKIAVSFFREYIDQKYYQHYVLNYLQQEHLRKRSSLVRKRQLKGRPVEEYVTKKDVKESEAPFTKEFLRTFTRNHPEIFKDFRESKAKTATAIKNTDLDEIDVLSLIDHLIKKLSMIASGSDQANEYHKLVIGMLELIFYPHLVNPVKEKEINDGRKRIDITFDNAATEGYFSELHKIHEIASRYIFVECKNYSEDPANPELDQLSGRFSVNNSKVGFLVCREVQNEALMNKRCVDLWKQKNELIVTLTDKDLVNILENIKIRVIRPEEETLRTKQRNIILS